MSVIAYIRVSTQVQPLESQEYEIRKWCEERSLSIDRWVTESVSGTISWERRMLGKAIRKMKSGDLLVCSEISRLGRNMLMIMSILNVCSQRRLRIHTIKDNFDLADNINSRIIAFAFALAAEIESSSPSEPARPLQRKRPPAWTSAARKGARRKFRKYAANPVILRLCLPPVQHYPQLRSSTKSTATPSPAAVGCTILKRNERFSKIFNFRSWDQNAIRS